MPEQVVQARKRFECIDCRGAGLATEVEFGAGRATEQEKGI